jgi:hypothetical protein
LGREEAFGAIECRVSGQAGAITDVKERLWRKQTTMRKSPTRCYSAFESR